MSFGSSVRARRIAEAVRLNELAKRIGVSPAYWSRVELEKENPPRDEYIVRAAAILGLREDDLFVEAGRLPPDMQRELREVVWAWRRRRYRPRENMTDVAAPR